MTCWSFRNFPFVREKWWSHKERRSWKICKQKIGTFWHGQGLTWTAALDCKSHTSLNLICAGWRVIFAYFFLRFVAKLTFMLLIKYHQQKKNSFLQAKYESKKKPYMRNRTSQRGLKTNTFGERTKDATSGPI